MKLKTWENPFAILGGDIHLGSSDAEIKALYRERAAVYHPDRPTGDSTRFIAIVAAYRAIQNEEARQMFAARVGFMSEKCRTCMGRGSMRGPFVRGRPDHYDRCTTCDGCGYK